MFNKKYSNLNDNAEPAVSADGLNFELALIKCYLKLIENIPREIFGTNLVRSKYSSVIEKTLIIQTN